MTLKYFRLISSIISRKEVDRLSGVTHIKNSDYIYTQLTIECREILQIILSCEVSLASMIKRLQSLPNEMRTCEYMSVAS